MDYFVIYNYILQNKIHNVQFYEKSSKKKTPFYRGGFSIGRIATIVTSA